MFILLLFIANNKYTHMIFVVRLTTQIICNFTRQNKGNRDGRDRDGDVTVQR